MAPPTGVIDGTARQFEIGQSVNDPGLERTPFGIPANCVMVPVPICAPFELLHYTWAIIYGTTPFGVSHEEDTVSALFVTTAFPGLQWTLTCTSFLIPDNGFYNGPAIIVIFGDFSATFYDPVQIDSRPSYLWTKYFGTTPPNPVITSWLPGP